MCFQCDNPELTYDDYLALVILPLVLRNGWAVQGVSGRRPFAYTIGLTDCGLPELLVTGMREAAAATLLNTVAARVLHQELEAEQPLELAAGLVLEVLRVDRPQDHLLTATALYGEQVRALQLVWPDEQGRYPWQQGRRAARGGQPVLGRRPREAS